MEAEGVLLGLGQLGLSGALCLQEGKGAVDVGLEEGASPVDQTVDAAIGGELHYGIDPLHLRGLDHSRQARARPSAAVRGRRAEDLRPDVVVNAAAYTAVDGAEVEPDRAFAVNRDGAAAAARAAAEMGVPFIHISTDYVFDGSKRTPYVETDPTGPINIYGASKRAGEEAVLEAHPQALILRTSWVFNPFGSNFVKTVLTAGATRPILRVVSD